MKSPLPPGNTRTRWLLFIIQPSHIYSLNSIRIHLCYDLLGESVPEDGDGNLLETEVVLNTGKENAEREREREREMKNKREKEKKHEGR